MLDRIASSYRRSLSLQQLTSLAKTCLKNAHNADDPHIALAHCQDAEGYLSQAKRTVGNDRNKMVVEGIAAAYIELGKLLESYGLNKKAEACFKETG